MRQTRGSVVCPDCGRLVGVGEEKCPHCGRWNPGYWGFSRALQGWAGAFGFVPLVIGACSLLYLFTLVADLGGVGGGGLFGLLSPSGASLQRFGASGLVPVVGQGRWWTVLSAGWLHGGLLHILFNMMWVRQLGPACVHVFGPFRTMVLYVLSSVVGFLFSSFGPFVPVATWVLGRGGYTVGASAAIFGLLGALVVAGRRGVAGSLGRQAWSYALILFLMGLLWPAVDNWAHLGGFVGGYAVGRWLDPMKPERPDHMIAAALLVVASFAAVVWSFVATGA